MPMALFAIIIMTKRAMDMNVHAGSHFFRRIHSLSRVVQPDIRFPKSARLSSPHPRDWRTQSRGFGFFRATSVAERAFAAQGGMSAVANWIFFWVLLWKVAWVGVKGSAGVGVRPAWKV